MTKLKDWGMCLGLILLCAATGIGAQAQDYDSLFSFGSVSGQNPYFVSLVQGADGSLYGTTRLGGSGLNCYLGCGTVFKITQDGALTTLHSFCVQSGCLDGAEPAAGLILATDGNFYGTTVTGGATGLGTVFKVTPEGALTTLYSFCAQPNCLDGNVPYTGLVQATDGNFYGTTLGGGTNSYGAVFKISSSGVLTTLYSFCAQENCSDGGNPHAGLIQATDGDLYGATSDNGSSGFGTVYKITLKGSLTTLHRFGGIEGEFPDDSLVQAMDGNLYGITAAGGANCRSSGGCGTVFKITLHGELTSLYSFCNPPRCRDGAEPYGALIQANDGKLYGTTSGGFYYGAGTVFSMTLEGALTTLHTFHGNDGSLPYGGLLQATSGQFFGTTYYGGTNNDGTVFRGDIGLGPFVTFVHAAGEVGQIGGILGQGFTGTTSVMLNGAPAQFNVVSDTYLTATVPSGATTGYVTVTTPSGVLKSNVPFHVIQ